MSSSRQDKGQSLQSQLQNFRKLVQQIIQELEKSLNSFVCAQAKFFFDCSQTVKNNIFEEWKKVNSSKEVTKDIKKSTEFIKSTIKNVIDSGSIILEHTKYVLEQQLGLYNPLQYIFQSKEINPTKPYQQEIKAQPSPLDRKFSPFDELKVTRTECPICLAQLSNAATLVKHIRKHEIDVYSQGYDCPHCDVTFSSSYLLIPHLFKKHYVQEEFNLTRRRSYYCPFTNQMFLSNQRSQLSHVIQSSPHYSRALDQILACQLDPQNKTRVIISETVNQQVKLKMPNQPNVNAEFIRGITKAIKINKKLYACPMCGLQESKTLKYMGGHIKRAHRIKFRNDAFCPHCRSEARYSADLAVHLICVHGRIEENYKGLRRQVYTTLNEIDFFDSIELTRHIINEEDYLTFFNPSCADTPFGLLPVNEKAKYEEKQSDHSQSDNE